MPFLCYDLKAIQSFIFRVPKLKYIIGGSAIVDEFDRDIAPGLAKVGICDLVSSGGGKGGYHCRDSTAADELERKLVQQAHQFGLDIRLGTHDDYSEAASCASRLYSYVPRELDGHPCPASGLYPTPIPGEPHPVIEKRVEQGRHARFEERLFKLMSLKSISDLAHPEFLRSIDAADRGGFGSAGYESMGRRARWAVVCMDGNDMGQQFRCMKGRDPSTLRRWVAEMSAALDETSTHACAAGIAAVVELWKQNVNLSACTYSQGGSDRTVLPIRPIIVGGDDIAVICHPAYAFEFVKASTQAWEEQSRVAADRSSFRKELWPASGGRLTISAGVFFCPSSMPLHAAVSYTELLLASAKRKGRESQSTAPSPSCIDWESATESMLDTPMERRKRELEFTDADRGDAVIRLTERPYSLTQFGELENLAHELTRSLPRSLRHEILPALRQGAHDRALYRYRMMKSHGDFADRLNEHHSHGFWTSRSGTYTTKLVDAISLLEELDRAGEDR